MVLLHARMDTWLLCDDFHILYRYLHKEVEVLLSVLVPVEVVSPVIFDLLPVQVALLENFEEVGMLEPLELYQVLLVPEVRLLASLSEVLWEAAFRLFLLAVAACKERAAVLWDGGLHVGRRLLWQSFHQFFLEMLLRFSLLARKCFEQLCNLVLHV